MIGQLWSPLPRLFRVMSNKEASVKDYYFLDRSKVSWRISCRRGLRYSEALEYESLQSTLANFFICRDEEDIRIWKHSSLGSFSVRSFYEVFSLALGSHLTYPLCGVAWFPQGSRFSSNWRLLVKSLLWVILEDEA